ncbi:phage major capsid protein [Fundicoccus ignavus]|uniref:Phage major capsid protein n=1 Tax=Fundicoccus ignavus TaxID=2664442 RepID=A0A844BYK8_9LACT|nr:phage major capsid protein [Fundicoccus ignavus]MRJ47084.1 phage major capsid protein [Fundicoccus ignavus]
MMQQLIEQRSEAWNQAKVFVESHRDEKGLMSDEDHQTYTQMEAEIENYTREIKRMEREKQMDQSLAQPTSKPLTSMPGNTNSHEKSGRARDEYKLAMLNAFRSNFRNVSNVLQEGIDTQGGYLVPEEYDERLIQGLEEENILRQLGTTVTTSGEHKINIAGAKPAGAWIEEGDTLTFGEAGFDQVVLDAHKLHVAIKVTEELLYDNAFNLENYLLEQFAKALANAEEEAFLNGNGQNKPLGIFASTGGGEVAVTTTSEKITSDDILTLVYALKRPYRKNAAFILNDSTLAVLRKLKDNNGAYIWQQSYLQGEPDRLLGYPVYSSAYAPEVKAGQPAIAFGDFSYYNIGDRGIRSFQELKELFAGNGMVGFVAKERVDGKLVLPEAVQVLSIGGAG